MNHIWCPKQCGVSAWCIVIIDSDTVVADSMTEDVARHISQLHNEWWLTNE